MLWVLPNTARPSGSNPTPLNSATCRLPLTDTHLLFEAADGSVGSNGSMRPFCSGLMRRNTPPSSTSIRSPLASKAIIRVSLAGLVWASTGAFDPGLTTNAALLSVSGVHWKAESASTMAWVISPPRNGRDRSPRNRTAELSMPLRPPR